MIFGSWKDRHTKHHLLKNDVVNNHKGDLLVIETPLLGRTITEDHKYYRVGKGHYMNTLGTFNNKDSEKDRWGIIRTDLGLEIKDWRKDGERCKQCSVLDLEWIGLFKILSMIFHLSHDLILKKVMLYW